MPPEFVYLASASPRRRELLQQIGVPFRVLRIDVDETLQPGEAPPSYVSRLAAAKAEEGWRQRDFDDAPVLGADTSVVINGRILGKPRDEGDAVEMLQTLSGHTHEVWTAVAVRSSGGLDSRTSRSLVTLRPLSAAQIRAYWHTGEPRDKAGAYAIQGLGAVFIADLHGSFSGVMGLPLFETAQLLDGAGIARWQPAGA